MIIPQLPIDKEEHFIVGFALALILFISLEQITHPYLMTMFLVTCAGMAKKVIDAINAQRSETSTLDLVATMIGGAFALIMIFAIKAL